MLQQLNETVSFLQENGIRNPETGIVLGTGLGKMVRKIQIIRQIPIPKFLTFRWQRLSFTKET